MGKFARRFWGVFVLINIYSVSVHARLRVDAADLERAKANPNQWYSEILARAYRPTVEEVVSILENCSECARLVEQSAPSLLPNLEAPIAVSLLAKGPQLIAFFESYFPNGQYSTLGRDAFYAADFLEAFYLAHGVHGRVVRLGLSGPSFAGLTSVKAKRDFLISNGYDQAKGESGERPFVIIDRTSYGANSQSSLLIQSLFEPLASDPAASMRLAQNVTVVSSASGNLLPLSPADYGQFQRDLADLRRWRSYAVNVPPNLHLPALGAFVDQTSLEWHKGFDSVFVTLPNGAQSGAPKQASGDRRLTLRAFWDLYQFVQNETFLAEMKRVADANGLDLEKNLKSGSSILSERVQLKDQLQKILASDLNSIFRGALASPLDPIGQKMLEDVLQRRQVRWQQLIAEDPSLSKRQMAGQLAQWRRQLESLRASSQVADPFALLLQEFTYDIPTLTVNASTEEVVETPGIKKSYFSANAQAVVDFVEEWNKVHGLSGDNVAALLRFIETASRLNLMTNQDNRRVALYALANLGGLDGPSVAAIRSAIESSPVVRRMMVKHSKVFLTSSRYSGRGRNVYLSLVEAKILPKSEFCESFLEAVEND